RILVAVLAVTAVVALVAALFWVQAHTAQREAHINLRAATAQKMNAQALGMLAGTTPGGDARALQQILAARRLTTPDDGVLYTAVVERDSTVKIINADKDAVDSVESVAFSPD